MWHEDSVLATEVGFGLIFATELSNGGSSDLELLEASSVIDVCVSCG